MESVVSPPPEVTRAKFDMSDEKKIVITELPVDSSSESLLNSIEGAYKAGKIKISSIDDFTTDHCQIEIKLPRGVYAKDVEKALYAYTDCEKSISCQMLVIKDNMPTVMSATEIIQYYAKKLTGIIKDEMEWEKGQLTEELHARTLERIFVEERIYKKIEQMKTAEAVDKAVKDGFKPFAAALVREVNDEDVEKLLKIPIRRISLFDINKNKDQVKAINARIKEINRRLKHLTDCAIEYLDGMLAKFRSEELERHTQIAKFTAVEVKKIVKRETPLRYDEKGYLGTSVSGGTELLKVTPYDRILFRSGIYTVCDVPERLFVDAGIWYCDYAEKERINKVLFTVIYRDNKTKYAYIKRCRIAGWILNRDYLLAPDGTEVLHIDTRERFAFTLHYEKKPRVKVTEEDFNAGDWEERGLKAGGIKISGHETASISVEPAPGQKELFS